MGICEKAYRAARAAHESVGQRRKYTNEPYIVHPNRVAKLVEEWGGTDEMIAAAYLHDVVEDTNATVAMLDEVFGSEIAELVEWLTDTTIPEDGNRATRCGINNKRLWQAPAEAQTIKCCDVLDNTRDIAKHDPDFARVYLKEKRELVEGLEQAYTPLREHVLKTIDELKASL